MRCNAFSVPRQVRIDLVAPPLYAAGKIVDVGKAGCAEMRGGLSAADAVVAIHDDLGIFPVLDFVDARRQFTEWNQRGIRQRDEGVLFRLAHIEQSRWSSRLKFFCQLSWSHEELSPEEKPKQNAERKQQDEKEDASRSFLRTREPLGIRRAKLCLEVVNDVLGFLEAKSAEFPELLDRLNFLPLVERISKRLALLRREIGSHDVSEASRSSNALHQSPPRSPCPPR